MLYSEAQALWVIANRVRYGTHVIYEREFVGKIAPGESIKDAGVDGKAALVGKECRITSIGTHHIEITEWPRPPYTIGMHFAPFYVLRVI